MATPTPKQTNPYILITCLTIIGLAATWYSTQLFIPLGAGVMFVFSVIILGLLPSNKNKRK